MSDEAAQLKQPPPSGDSKKAEKYINQLVELLDNNKLNVNHTDLTKYDPGAMQDHYRMTLKDYHVEVSHSKNPQNGVDSYVIIFTNVKVIQEECTEKVILAYMHLDPAQFAKFKKSADAQIDRNKKLEEEKRLSNALSPIDDLLAQIKTGAPEVAQNAQDGYTGETLSSMAQKTPLPAASENEIKTGEDVKIEELHEETSDTTPTSQSMPEIPEPKNEIIAQQVNSSAI